MQKARTQPLPINRPFQNAWHRRSSIAVLNTAEFSELSDKTHTKKQKKETTVQEKTPSVSTVSTPTAALNTDDIAAKMATILEDKFDAKISAKIDNALSTRVITPFESLAQSIKDLLNENKALNERITKIETYLNQTTSPNGPTPLHQAHAPLESMQHCTHLQQNQENPHAKHAHATTSTPKLQHSTHQTQGEENPGQILTSLGTARSKSRSLFSQPTEPITQDMSILDCSRIDKDDSLLEDEIDTAVEHSSGGYQE